MANQLSIDTLRYRQIKPALFYLYPTHPQDKLSSPAPPSALLHSLGFPSHLTYLLAIFKTIR